MASRTKSVRTFDAVQVRALPGGGFVVSARNLERDAPYSVGQDLAAFDDIEGVIGWLDGAAHPGEGFDVLL